MNIQGMTNLPSVDIGGRIFTNLAGLKIIRSQIVINAGAARYSSSYDVKAGAIYVVPTGKTFECSAFQYYVTAGTLQDLMIGYGDTDIGLNSAAAPTNFLYAVNNDSNLSIIASPQALANVALANSFAFKIQCYFEIPAAKYLTMYIGLGTAAAIQVFFYGYEV